MVGNCVTVRSNCSVLDIGCYIYDEYYNLLPKSYYTDDINGICYEISQFGEITGVTECVTSVLMFNESTDLPVYDIKVDGLSVTYVSGDNFTVDGGENGTFETANWGAIDVSVYYSNHTNGRSITAYDSYGYQYGCNTNTSGGICTFPSLFVSPNDAVTITASDTPVSVPVNIDNLTLGGVDVPVYDVKINDVSVTYISGSDFVITSGESGTFETTELGYYNIDVYYSSHASPSQVEIIDSYGYSYFFTTSTSGGVVTLENVLVQINAAIYIIINGSNDS
jgi:hypothetical protein